MRLFFRYSLLLLPLLLLNSASAQSAPPLHSAATLKRNLKKLVGKELRVDAKFKECWGGNVYIRGLNLKFVVQPGTPVSKALLANPPKDSKGYELKTKISNVLITGRLVDNKGETAWAPKGLIFLLADIARTKDDIPRYEDFEKRALQKNPKDFQALHDLAQNARSWGRTYENKDLIAWAAELDRRALQLHGTVIPPTDLSQLETFAELYIRKLGDTTGAISVLDKVHSNTKDAAQKARVRKRLEGLDAYYYKGKWVAYSEFKKQEGYLKRKIGETEQWVRRERAELLDMIEKDKQRRESGQAMAPGIDAQYVRGAKQGRVVDGMRRSHLVILKDGEGSLGFPHFVDRVLIKVKDRNYVYDQWIFNDQRRFYFVNDRLFARCDAKLPLPRD